LHVLVANAVQQNLQSAVEQQFTTTEDKKLLLLLLYSTAWTQQRSEEFCQPLSLHNPAQVSSSEDSNAAKDPCC
jgi:hypothetical protein